MKLLVTSILIAICWQQANAQTCDCKTSLRFTINKISTNYAGYKDKVRPDNLAAFNAFTDSLMAAAEKADSTPSASCMQILKQWTGFFKDRHMYYYSGRSATPVSAESVRKGFIDWPKVSYSEKSFRQYLKSGKHLQPLEGIWKLDDYLAGVIFIKDGYKGFILKADSVYWLPGQVKFTLPRMSAGKAVYYKRDHTADTCSFVINNSQKTILTIGSYGAWYKLNTATGLPYETITAQQDNAVFFKRLSSKTNLLTIKSFDNSFIHAIDSVVNTNDSLLRHTNNLVIDVRGNGGGADAAYEPLKKYLYTHPYKQIGVDFYCSDDNIQNFRTYAANTNFSEADRKEFTGIADSMSRHKQSFWSPFNDSELVKMDSALPFPRQIVVLADEGCGSTTEQFLLDPVINSSKAIIMGAHSAGVLDYANVNFLPLPCAGIEIGYATSRSRRIEQGKGIDNTGILPDLPLKDTAGDWVQLAQKYLESGRSLQKIKR